MQDISRTKNLSHAAIEEVVDLMSEVVSRKRLGASNQKLALEFISMHLPLVSRQISAAVTE
jgi:hypothetical protein